MQQLNFKMKGLINLKTAKAAIFKGVNQPFEVKEYPLSTPEKGQALLKLCISGVCGTDVHIMKGRLAMPTPLIIGHEFIGEIVEINGSGFDIGEKVIFNVATPCGECLLCKNGDSANCLNFQVAFAQNPENSPHFFGGFAEYTYASINNLVRIPKEVDYRAASVFPCAGPTITHALKLGGIFQSKAKNIKTAVVQGIGPVGMFAAIWLHKAEIENIVVICKDVSSARASMAQSIGITYLVEPEQADEYVSKLTNGLGADLVIECSGNPAAFLQGTRILRNRGIYLVPGQYSDSGNVSFGPQVITFKALQIIGSSQYDMTDVADYLEFLKQYPDLQSIISNSIKIFKIDDINEALAYAQSHAVCKVVLSNEV